MNNWKMVFILVSFLGVLGCSSGDFPTAKVEGVVLCEGKPVQGAAVYFEPLQSESADGSAIVGKQGFSFTDAEGKFQISTYLPGQNDGAVIGRHRVRVGRGDAKCNCSLDSEKDVMQVEVKKGELNRFEVVLEKASDAKLKKEKEDRIKQGIEEDGT